MPWNEEMLLEPNFAALHMFTSFLNYWKPFQSKLYEFLRGPPTFLGSACRDGETASGWPVWLLREMLWQADVQLARFGRFEFRNPKL